MKAKEGGSRRSGYDMANCLRGGVGLSFPASAQARMIQKGSKVETIWCDLDDGRLTSSSSNRSLVFFWG